MKVKDLIKKLRVEDMDKNIIVTESDIIFIDKPQGGCHDGVCEIEGM